MYAIFSEYGAIFLFNLLPTYIPATTPITVPIPGIAIVPSDDPTTPKIVLMPNLENRIKAFTAPRRALSVACTCLKSLFTEAKSKSSLIPKTISVEYGANAKLHLANQFLSFPSMFPIHLVHLV